MMPLNATAQQNAKGLPAPSDLLEFRPKFIQSFEYDTPSDQAAINACKVESVLNDQNRSVGYTLRDGQGKLLTSFCDRARHPASISGAITRTDSRSTARKTWTATGPSTNAAG